MSESKAPSIKTQMKLKLGHVQLRTSPDDAKPREHQQRHQPKVYSSLDNYPRATSSTRFLGGCRTSESKNVKETEKDFLLLRKLIEMGELRRPDQKLPFKNTKLKAREERIKTPPTPLTCGRQRGSRSKSMARAPNRFNLNQVKRISIADFRRSKMPGFLSFICSRKQAPRDLTEKTRSVHCDLFGPGLCPDCQKIETRYEFSEAQDLLFPHLDVTSRSLVAAPKLKNQPTPFFWQGRWYLTSKNEVGYRALQCVHTEKDMLKREERRSSNGYPDILSITC